MLKKILKIYLILEILHYNRNPLITTVVDGSIFEKTSTIIT